MRIAHVCVPKQYLQIFGNFVKGGMGMPAQSASITIHVKFRTAGTKELPGRQCPLRRQSDRNPDNDRGRAMEVNPGKKNRLKQPGFRFGSGRVEKTSSAVSFDYLGEPLQSETESWLSDLD